MEGAPASTILRSFPLWHTPTRLRKNRPGLAWVWMKNRLCQAKPLPPVALHPPYGGQFEDGPSAWGGSLGPHWLDQGGQQGVLSLPNSIHILYYKVHWPGHTSHILLCQALALRKMILWSPSVTLLVVISLVGRIYWTHLTPDSRHCVIA